MFKKVRKKIATYFLISFGLFMSFVGGGRVLAQSSSNPPSFPSCTGKIFSQNGDWAHYDFGMHGIPGVGNFEGRDDVYSLSGGNFLQCFCPVNGSVGIQSNWWNIERAELTDEQVGQFTSVGWIFEGSGLGWNLFDEKYLVKNENFNCTQPSPTSTPTITQTPTPTVTPSPTTTPTPGPEPEQPHCVGLSASPTEGTATLTVKFTGSGFDKNGPILEYEFDFGDASGGQPQVWKQTGSEASHRYDNPGTYTASLKVKDQGGTWRDGSGDCKKTITVRTKPQVLSATLPTELPSAGAAAFSFLSLVPVGFYLYRRFKLL
jgi:hypothetical protein